MYTVRLTPGQHKCCVDRNAFVLKLLSNESILPTLFSTACTYELRWGENLGRDATCTTHACSVNSSNQGVCIVLSRLSDFIV